MHGITIYAQREIQMGPSISLCMQKAYPNLSNRGVSLFASGFKKSFFCVELRWKLLHCCLLLPLPSLAPVPALSRILGFGFEAVRR